MNLEGHPANNLEDNPLIDGLRASGAKITAQRIAICNWLLNTNTHPTANAVYEAIRDDFPTMSLATVYNTLSLLEGLGLLHQVARAGACATIRRPLRTSTWCARAAARSPIYTTLTFPRWRARRPLWASTYRT